MTIYSLDVKVKIVQLCPAQLYSPWNSPGQNIGVCSLSLLQGIFPTQVSSLGLPHYRQSLYQLSHKGSPRILKRVAYPFSRGSSLPRNWTGISCIAGRFFTNWATREALSGSPLSTSVIRMALFFFTKDEPMLTLYNHPEFIDCLKVYSKHIT